MIKKEDNLKTAPNSLIFVSLASMYLDNGMVDEAIDLCKSGLKIEPENEEAHLILAQAEMEKGSIDNAQKRLVKLLQRNPENAAAKGLLDQMEKRKKDEEGKSEEVKPEEGKGKSEEVKEEEGRKKKEEIVKDEISEEEKRLEELLTGNIDDIIRIEGVINCFFRLKTGRIIKSANFVGQIDEVLPMLDSLLDAVKSSSQELNMGEVTLILIEIEKGIFYIFASSDYDCFLMSKNADNFGLVKAILPRILG